MLLITGTQRSGTTTLLEFLDRAGYKTGREMGWDKEVSGGRENLNINNFIKEYIGDKNFPFKGFPEAKPKIKNLNIEIAKCSYLLMSPVFVNIYYKFRGNKDKIVVLNRNKSDVIMSKKNHWKQFKKDSLLLKQNVSELTFNFIHSLQLLDKYNFEYKILDFPYYLNSFKYVKDKLENLGIDIKNKKDLFYNIIDKDRVNF